MDEDRDKNRDHSKKNSTGKDGRQPDQTGPRLVYFAAERTLLSWVRASLSLIVLGFAVDRFGLFVNHYSVGGMARPYPESCSLVIGTILVATGALMNTAAAIRYLRFARHYHREGSTDPRHGLSLAALFALLITLIVAGIMVYLITMVR